MAKRNNVVALGKKKEDQQAARLAMAERYAEAMCKDNPSAETKEWFKRELGSNPEEWRKHGDLMKDALDLGLEKFWLGYATKESVKHGAELLKAELGFDEASPIEKLLIEQAVLCHVRLGMVEHVYSRHFNGTNRMDVLAHWEMRLTLCHRRYLKAITTLQKVRVMLARVPNSIQRPGQAQALAKRA
jgi:hypothetical protein